MPIGTAWNMFRKVERLFEFQEVHRRAIEELRQSHSDLERRVARLEHREDIVVGEAKAAARAASSEATQGTLADLARRIGVLEAGASRTTGPRIGKPKPG